MSAERQGFDPAALRDVSHVPYGDLPVAWRAALRFCPYCSSAGCARCGGTGDLLGAMLVDAYRRGREGVLLALREVEAARRFAVAGVLADEPDAGELKRAMGL